MVDPLEIRDVFDRAASLPPKERGAFLARACGTNEALRHEVERLLAADARLGSAFDTEPGSDPATGSSAAAAMSLHPAHASDHTRSSTPSASAVWAKSTRRAIRASSERSRSKFYPTN